MSTLYGATISSFEPFVPIIGSNLSVTDPIGSLSENTAFSSQIDQAKAGKDLTKIILIVGGILVAGTLIYYTYHYIEEQNRWKYKIVN
jgi:hypothetical protein